MGLDLPEERSARASGPRAADHALQLYTRTLHPELLSFARDRRLVAPTWRARVGLLRDLGHVIEVVVPARPGPPATEARALCEVMAPLALDLPHAGRIDIRRVGASASGTVDDDAGLAFVCGWSYERLGAGPYAEMHGRVLASSPRGERLLVMHGHPENDGRMPFSLLDLAARPDGFETFAVHAFPDDRGLFFVQSAFTAR